MSAKPRLALASSFSGGDGAPPSDPAQNLFKNILGFGNARSYYTDPHQRISTFDIHGDYDSRSVTIAKAAHKALGLKDEFKRGDDRPVRYTEERVQQIQQQAHFLLLQHQKENADKMGGWVAGDLLDIETTLSLNEGSNPMASAFAKFSRSINFAVWRQGLSTIKSSDIVVPLRKTNG